MRMLVSGGGGFIGSHVAELLVALGHEVVILDRCPAHIPGGLRNDPRRCQRVRRGPDCDGRRPGDDGRSA